MPSSRLAHALLALLVLIGVALAPAALAQEPPPQEPTAGEALTDPSLFGQLDELFGRYVVAPLEWVMFADVIFWDNTLPAGQGVGLVVDGEVVTGHGEGGYVYQRRLALDTSELVPAPEEPVQRRMGALEVEILNANGQLVARAPSQAVDLAAIGVDPEGSELVTVTTIAPFPVQVDPTTARTVETTAPVPSDTLPIVAGMQVETPAGAARVLSIEAGRAEVLLSEPRIAPGLVPNPDDRSFPLVVAWLLAGAVFFTLRMQFVNLRLFPHALRVVTGAYDDPEEAGEISHFQALASALSATVGLGNIAGVAIAITIGGPGAVVWMVVAAFFGMSSKFTECSLGQMYRVIKPDGSVSGGPMHYLDTGLAELGLGWLGKAVAVLFAVMCIGGSLGGGNMFQANQSYLAVADVIPLFEGRAWLYGILLAACVGVVIIGGIRRIGTATSIIVPIMCGVYVLAGLWILAVNATAVPAALGTMLSGAFTSDAGLGGLIGVIVAGFQRAAFSNEAGVGSASIAHSAASTSEPIREGVVALLEPFIDTIIVCTMTGLVVVVTGAYLDTEANGVVLTSQAFATVIDWFPLVLSFAVVMFAFSTMISWSYYGERCATWLVGDWAVLPYRVVFLVAVFAGAVFEMGNVLAFSDLMVLGMAFPNIFGAVLLSGKVKERLDRYLATLRSGGFEDTPAPERAAS